MTSTKRSSLKMSTRMRSPALAVTALAVLALDGLESDFLDHAHGRHVRLGEVAGHGLVHLRRLDEVDVADLRGLVAVLRQRLELRDHARTSLQHRHRVNIPAVVEDLRHADLLTENSCYGHCDFLSSSCWPVRLQHCRVVLRWK